MVLEDADATFFLWLLASPSAEQTEVADFVRRSARSSESIVRLLSNGFIRETNGNHSLTARGIRILRLLKGDDVSSTDLSPVALEDLSWEAEKREQSLEILREHVKWRAREALTWYQRSKAPVRRSARWTRFTAIVATALAGAIPVISQLWPPLPASVATLALAFGALVLALDKFFGFSSSWMRYTSAELALHRLLAGFDLQWEKSRAKNADWEERLSMAQDFLARVGQVVEEETKAWVSEFRQSLRATERPIESAVPSSSAVRIEADSGQP